MVSSCTTSPEGCILLPLLSPLLVPLLLFASRTRLFQGFYDVALRKEAERRAEAEEEYQVRHHSLSAIGPLRRLIAASACTARKRLGHGRAPPQGDIALSSSRTKAAFIDISLGCCSPRRLGPSQSRAVLTTV